MFLVVQRIGWTRESGSGALHEKLDAGSERNRIENVLPVTVPGERISGPRTPFAGMRDPNKRVGGVLGPSESVRVAEVVLQSGTEDGCSRRSVDVDDWIRL